MEALSHELMHEIMLHAQKKGKSTMRDDSFVVLDISRFRLQTIVSTLQIFMGNRKGRSRARKRRFSSNQFSSKTTTDEVLPGAVAQSASSVAVQASASERKISGVPDWILDSSASGSSDDDSSQFEADSDTCDSADDSLGSADPLVTSGYRLVDLEVLQNIVSTVAVCKSCKVGELQLRESCRSGLASSLVFTCNSCEVEFEAPIVKKTGHYYDCNRRSVLAGRVIGCGHADLQKFCGVMNLPPPVAWSNFRAHQCATVKAAISAGEESMRRAAAEVRELNAQSDPPQLTAVTYDGTWMRRGFCSLFGVFPCIHWGTGRVLDLVVCSKYCHACTTWKARRELELITAEEYLHWQADHLGKCTANTECSAPAMEAEAAVTIWSRSKERHNLQYDIFIGDGDSKSYHAVQESKPYGEDVIEKSECIGHVQKRVGGRLRKLKASMKGQKLSDGKLLSGAGRLTDETIDSLQTFYGMAIRDNCQDLKSMATAIWASLYHRASSDQKPLHMFCPTGADSWCGWQRVKAGKQATYAHPNVLPEAIVELVKPIYRDLTSRDLLSRCLLGATQNQNESLNSLIWSLCPKEGFCGKSVVEMSAHLAAAHYNHGAVSLMAVLRNMGCEVGVFTERELRRQDAERRLKAARKMTESEKKRRKLRRRRRKGLAEQRLDLEGSTYAAGEF